MTVFIETLAPLAMKQGKAYNILPSLIIAQGIHETGSGASELARNANNLFGIKKGSGWSGEVYPVVTHEYRKNAAGEDEKYYITAEFRKYDSFEGAVIDLCEKYNKMSRYAAVPGNFVFHEAAQKVKDAGYATDPSYV
ncbi:MAG: glucosaminidase domain-containing protein, partial [Actinobacteria bacterium]|nr:glucosaminidase domain-containing protein [Actinomycetota bacterium]